MKKSKIEKLKPNEPIKPRLHKAPVSKRKYWYRDDVEVCVLCGKETHNKKRVYNESEKGTFWEEGACWGHF